MVPAVCKRVFYFCAGFCSPYIAVHIYRNAGADEIDSKAIIPFVSSTADAKKLINIIGKRRVCFKPKRKRKIIKRKCSSIDSAEKIKIFGKRYGFAFNAVFKSYTGLQCISLQFLRL